MKFKVGDKVKLVNVEMPFDAEGFIKNGIIGEIVKVSNYYTYPYELKFEGNEKTYPFLEEELEEVSEPTERDLFINILHDLIVNGREEEWTPDWMIFGNVYKEYHSTSVFQTHGLHVNLSIGKDNIIVYFNVELGGKDVSLTNLVLFGDEFNKVKEMVETRDNHNKEILEKDIKIVKDKILNMYKY
jgi:hypothetical protein